jgi:tetratricopeptide (TPR) repeat protein
VLVLRALDSAWERPSGRRWLGAGLLIGLAALARPNFLLLAPVGALLALLASPERRPARALLVLAGALLLVAPVTVRNRIVSGEWIPLSYQAGLNLWIGNNPDADGMSATLPGFSSWRNEDVEALLARDLGRRPTPSEQDAHFRALALDYLATRPGDALAGFARKTWLFLQAYEIRNNRDLYALRERNALLRLPLPDWGWILPLALVGAVAARRRARELVPTYAYALTMAAGTILFFVCARYRLPAWPAFLVLAGAGVEALVGAGRSVPARAAAAVAVVALFALARVAPAGVRNPDRSQVHFQYGNVYARAERTDDAEAEYREALSLAPRFGEAHHHLGALLLREGRLREAIPELEAAVRVLPRSFRARRSLAEAYEAAGRPDLAIPVRREVVDLTAGAPVERFALATTLGMAGQYREALDIFLELDGTALADDPDFLLNAGQTALALKKEALGVGWLERATRVPGAREAAYDALARYWLSLRRWDEGLRVLSEALLRVPDSPSLLRLRARARHATGDATGAIEDWSRVLELDPADDTARTELEALRAGTGS